MPNPTGEKNKVISMASVGISVKLIARRMNCTVEELEQRYEAELKAALPQIKAKVGAHLFAAAQSGNIAAIIFWLKTRAGWRENTQREPPAPPIKEMNVFPPGLNVFLGCNGRCAREKIINPHERRAIYEKILGYKLPVLDDYPTELTPEQRALYAKYAHAIAQWLYFKHSDLPKPEVALRALDRFETAHAQLLARWLQRA